MAPYSKRSLFYFPYLLLLEKFPLWRRERERERSGIMNLWRVMLEMQAYMVGLTCMGIEGAGAVVFPFRNREGNSTAFFLGLWTCSAKGRQRRSSRCSPRAAAAASDSPKDHYAVLGLSSRASSADIKRAYRLLALKVLSRRLSSTTSLFLSSFNGRVWMSTYLYSSSKSKPYPSPFPNLF